MTEQDITILFKRYKRYEAEIAILQDCVDELHDADTADSQTKYALLKRRITLSNHWINYLPQYEAEIVKLHLIEGHSWVYLANYFSTKQNNGISCDERTLQRLQNKALKRIKGFVAEQFSDKLDYLIDSEHDIMAS